MDSNNNQPEFNTESLFEQKFFIHKVTIEGEDGEFFMIGFDPGGDQAPQAVTIDVLEQLPQAMMWWAQKIMIEHMGWKPPKQPSPIVAPEKKLIIPKH